MQLRLTLAYVFLCLGLLPGTLLSAEWRSLFNGKNLDGWTVKCRPQDKDKTGYWKVVDGTITAESPPGSKHHYIWLLTEEEFGDFEIRMQVQTFASATGNSALMASASHPPDRI